MKEGISAAEQPGLELLEVQMRFPDVSERRRILAGVSLSVNPGEMFAIHGRSGSGKSTLLNIAGGLLAPEAGTVRLGGHTLDYRKPASIARERRKYVGYVPQSYDLIEDESIYTNVTLPLSFGTPKSSKAQKRAAAAHMLERVELALQLRTKVRQLSGGEKQRVAVARALIGTPGVLIVDEPTAALDEQSAAKVIQLLRGIADGGASVLLATHDPQVSRACDYVSTLRDGTLYPEAVR